jgi:phospholipase/carboxylesterase
LSDGVQKTTTILAHEVLPPRQASKIRPGLILLHGRGADEHDLLALAGHLDPRFLVVSARAPLSLSPGFEWYRLGAIGEPDLPTLRSGLADLKRFVAEVVTGYAIDPTRLFLLGFSQGAVMSCTYALMNPDDIAGVVALSGYIPTGVGLPFQLDRLDGRGFFVAHGTHDAVIPVRFGRDASEFLAQTAATVTYREYPVGHQITLEILDDVAHWLSNRLEVARSGD